MSQMKAAVAVGIFGITLAVALVKAQETQEPRLFETEVSGAPRRLEPTPATPRSSPFRQEEPAASGLRSSAFDAPASGTSDALPDTTRRGSAADRLKQVRSSGSVSTTRSGASVVGPVTANPAELDQSQTSEEVSP